MISVTLWSWVLTRLARNAWMGLGALALVVLIPVLQGIRPVPSAGGALALAATWAFPAGVMGVASSLVPLSTGAGLLARLDPPTRWVVELGALVLGAAYLQLPILAGALLAGAAPSDLGALAPAILTADLHLGALALLLLTPALTLAQRTSLYLALAWLLPALASSDATLGRVSAWIDAGAPLRAPPGTGVLPSLAAASALLLAGYLLRTGAPRTKPG